MTLKNSESSTQSPDDTLSFEASLKELEDVVRKLESGHTTLEEAISLYERGSILKNRCETVLNDARLKIEQIVHKEGKDLGISASELSKLLPPNSPTS